MESEAKKMKFQESSEKVDIKEEPTDEVEIMVVEEDEMAEESMVKSEPNEGLKYSAKTNSVNDNFSYSREIDPGETW